MKNEDIEALKNGSYILWYKGANPYETKAFYVIDGVPMIPCSNERISFEDLNLGNATGVVRNIKWD
jgi:hypothetical protein